MPRRSRRGYTYLHVAIDDYSRVADVEALDNERADTLCGFWRRAQGWFWSNQMPVDEILTDNGPNFTSDKFAELLAERAIKHRRACPYRPQTNGEAERFNRTLADEFLYARVFKSETDRRVRLTRRVHDYNCHRHHTAVGGPPAGSSRSHLEHCRRNGLVCLHKGGADLWSTQRRNKPTLSYPHFSHS